MRFFDLHCDTLYEILTKKTDLSENCCHISTNKLDCFSKYYGCFAIWIPPEFRGDAALQLFDKAFDKLNIEIKKSENKIFRCENFQDFVEKNYKNNVIFTVEGGAVLGGEISKLDHLKKCGVKMITLTWNGKCEIGDGVGVENPKGLSDFGKKTIKKMEDLNIIVDVSHASEKLFYDIAEYSEKPFIASHSNSKFICSHERNLTDEQFKIINEKGGIVGINLSKAFLKNDRNPNFSDILRHIDRFLSLGGENIVCFGSDFDGTDIPDCMTGIESIPNFYEFCLKNGYSESLLDKIFYSNAYEFFENNVFNIENK